MQTSVRISRSVRSTSSLARAEREHGHHLVAVYGWDCECAPESIEGCRPLDACRLVPRVLLLHRLALLPGATGNTDAARDSEVAQLGEQLLGRAWTPCEPSDEGVTLRYQERPDGEVHCLCQTAQEPLTPRVDRAPPHKGVRNGDVGGDLALRTSPAGDVLRCAEQPSRPAVALLDDGLARLKVTNRAVGPDEPALPRRQVARIPASSMPLSRRSRSSGCACSKRYSSVGVIAPGSRPIRR